MEWINRIHVQRIALKSCVVIIETSDWRRIEELRSILPKLAFFKDSKIYVFNAGRGLSLLENGKLKPVTKESESNPYTIQTNLTIGSLIEILENELKSESITLFIEAMPEDIESKLCNISTRTLNTKLLNYTRYPELYKAKSTVIIATPYPEEIFSKTLLNEAIYESPPMPNQEEREKIIRSSIEIAENEARNKKRLDWLKTIKYFKNNVKHLARITAGLNIKQIQDTILTSIYYMVAKLINRPEDYIIKEKDKMVHKTSGGVLKIEIPKYGFESIGGLNALKEYVKENMINPLLEEDRAKKLGLELPRGILLFGAPGTGKTVFSKAIGKELGLPFITMRPNLVFQKWVGSSEARITRAIKLIEDISPAIVYIDEIDRLGRRTDVSTDSGVSRRVFSTILEWLGREDRKAIIIGSTNTINQLDSALIRAGRFSLIAPVLYPSRKAREEILQIHTRIKRRIPLDENVDFSEIAKETSYWTGAELEEMVNRAVRIAFNKGKNRVDQEDFIDALQLMRVDEAFRKTQLQMYLSQAKLFTNDNKLLENLEKELSEI